MSNPHVADALNQLFGRRSAFVLIGLTGRTGSGCTTAAALLSKEFPELKLPEPQLTDAKAEERKYRIIKDYAQRNWQPFFTISISNVILSFLLDSTEKDIRAFFVKAGLLKNEQLNNFINSWQPAQTAWLKAHEALRQSGQSPEQMDDFLIQWHGPISDFFKIVRGGLGPSSTTILQVVGDNLRKSGEPFSDEHIPRNFYTLPNRIAQLVTLVRDLQLSRGKPAYIVLDALRNPFELLYFRERFAAFYVLAISTPNEDRERRLSVRQNYNAKQIAELDSKEYPEKNKPLSGYDAFTSQNIQSCLEKADVYISNSGFVPPNQDVDTTGLSPQLVKYFALILHPGLITPTRSERCMQIAFAARANSGCISRQVGAAITDENDSVKAVGWNDVPAGQVPCLLRRATDLIGRQDQGAGARQGSCRLIHAANC
ncbi:hypothetical protein [Polaromonas sp.]|uniref:hypothetical protein n=1 Tax=Polaromonas sp. TaxID=1869339 RepID=UPI002730FCC2|nr:hypothetical protein [Polaromonas sp.]MDP2450810.1 hypothetical protein [Polaromonas sp.]MDP3754083.1 hypothetical protein [Polaromonas sp.]